MPPPRRITAVNGQTAASDAALVTWSGVGDVATRAQAMEPPLPGLQAARALLLSSPEGGSSPQPASGF